MREKREKIGKGKNIPNIYNSENIQINFLHGGEFCIHFYLNIFAKRFTRED